MAVFMKKITRRFRDGFNVAALRLIVAVARTFVGAL